MNVRIVVLLSEQEDYFFIIIHKCAKVHLSLRVNVYSAKIVIIKSISKVTMHCTNI
jgi:hypothetical protein